MGGVHWPVADLVEFAAEGIREIAAVLPHEFVEIIDMPLTASATQQLPPGYVDIARIIGRVDPATGELDVDSVERIRSDAATRLRGKFQCSGTGTVTHPARFDLVEHGRGEFIIKPTPSGGEILRIAAIAEPLAIDTTNYTTPLAKPGDAYEPILTHWILARAYEVDAESDVANDRASYFRNRFYTEINAAYAAASRMRSGYVLGQTGDDDAHISPARFNERRVFG